MPPARKSTASIGVSDSQQDRHRLAAAVPAFDVEVRAPVDSHQHRTAAWFMNAAFVRCRSRSGDARACSYAEKSSTDGAQILHVRLARQCFSLATPCAVRQHGSTAVHEMSKR